MTFKEGFIWGAATSAYQVEGAVDEGGRGSSVWDRLCLRKGAILNGHHGEIACDHYHRFHEDVTLMKDLGLNGYRFSFSWSRLLPEGIGKPNGTGIEFYDRLIDDLLNNGIEPFATIFHWDYPYELFKRGGWLNPDSPEWFGEYTALLADRFSDRVRNWFTLNEPSCFLGLGHVDGVHAPGLKLDWPDFFLAVKHAMMAHGRSVQVLRSRSARPVMISYAPISDIAIPIDNAPENIEAAREYAFGLPDPKRSFWPEVFYVDSVLKGIWPEEAISQLTEDGPKVTESDLKLMCQPIDALGLNFYAAAKVKAGPDGKPEVVRSAPGQPRTGFDWAVTPEGLYWSARLHHERYGLPIYITENGLSSLDWVAEDGHVHDPQRIDYVSKYLRSLRNAASEGCPIEGYFHWSLMDNFEWAEGYRHRFGLVHVDFETQRRTVKDSGWWYRRVIETNGAHLGMHAPALVEDLRSSAASVISADVQMPAQASVKR